jgi:gag-polypeptide of LTR copia-type
MSSNTINTVPVFASVNFHTWQQQMGDFLSFQRLWRITSGITTRPIENAPADLLAQDAWDEADEQAKGILGLRLSPNLHMHLAATAALSWTALDNAFGQPGIGSVSADLQAALHVKISGGQNLQVEMLTLFERLHANGMTISDPIQGIMLLNALPAKWDSIAMVYLQGQNVLANVTFAMVRDAITVEYEQTSCPSTLAVQKISAVKHKGKSPQFREQTNTYKFAPKASDDAPSRDAPKKKR